MSRATTYFAPAERASREALARTIAAITDNPVMAAVLRAFGGVVLVLNPQRQLVAANSGVLDLLGIDDATSALGLRPGEALHCVHARDNPEGGCGTSPFCATCGAAITMVACQRSGAPAEAECLITAAPHGVEEAFEFKVRAAPIHAAGEDLYVVSLQDIRDQKRREALESVFFHDILNTVAAIRGTGGVLLRVRGEAARRECVQTIAELTDRLAAEISEQREMADLEAGRFQARFAYVSTSQVRELIGQFFAGQEVASGKRLTLGGGDDIVLHTDLVLLQRALANLVKNALEATPAGGEVRVGHEAGAGRVTFAVWNAGAMAPTTALRVFQRYFTTKGERGRGLGTYGTKLIVERHLGGHVSFTTTEAEGTTFRIELPRDDAEPACHAGRKDSPD